jgi:hypothetical protein
LFPVQVLPNWYVAGDSSTTQPRIIKSTAGEGMEFVGAFDSVEKTIRGDEDMYRPFTPAQRFHRNRLSAARDVKTANILPTPLVVKQHAGKQAVYISGNWKVIYSKDLHNEARYLKG